MSPVPSAPRVHLHLPVTDLEASTRFYTLLFDSDPVKSRPGYAKFLPDWSPLNLALTTAPSEVTRGGTREHYGLQVDDPAEVLFHLDRVRAAGIPVEPEMGVDCCHANQDKFWATDPDGRRWEVYHLNRDLPETVKAKACCAPA